MRPKHETEAMEAEVRTLKHQLAGLSNDLASANAENAYLRRTIDLLRASSLGEDLPHEERDEVDQQKESFPDTFTDSSCKSGTGV